MKPLFPNEKILITRIFNVYKEKDLPKDINKLLDTPIHYIFNAQYQNTTKFTSRILVVKILLKNTRAIPTILYINLNENPSKDTFTFYPNEESSLKQFYNIYNNLFLMDPFKTSGQEIIISKDMKENFDKVLVDHTKTFSGLQLKN